MFYSLRVHKFTSLQVHKLGSSFQTSRVVLLNDEAAQKRQLIPYYFSFDGSVIQLWPSLAINASASSGPQLSGA